MAIAAITAFAALAAAGILLEVLAANTRTATAIRRQLNHVFRALWAYPGRLVRWHHKRREESYHPPKPGKRSSITKWAMRAHVAVLIPLAAYFGAGALEAFAADDKPIFGLYFTPEQAWYLGAVTGGVFAAVAPLIAYIVFWFTIVLPYTVVSIIVTWVGRFLVRATDGESGRDQAPFAILGGVLGSAVAAVLFAL